MSISDSEYGGATPQCNNSHPRLDSRSRSVSQDSESGHVFSSTYDLGDIESVLKCLDSGNEYEFNAIHDKSCIQVDENVPCQGSLEQKFGNDLSSPNGNSISPKDTVTLRNSTGTKIKGILKKRGRFSSESDDDGTKRYSLGSASSNSSGDTLDFSLYTHWPVDNASPYGYSSFPGMIHPSGAFGHFSPDDIAHRVDIIDESYYEEQLHRGTVVTSDLFSMTNDKQIYKQVLDVCNQNSE